MFSGEGTIFTYTKLSDPNAVPKGFEFNAPYYIAIIELKEGPRITAQLTDMGDEKPTIGMKGEMVTRKLRVEGDSESGIIVYGYKFRPRLRHEKV